MRNVIRFLLDLVGVPGDVEAVGKILTAIGGLSLMSGIWATWQQGLHWGVFIGMGVFAFGTYIYSRLTTLKDETRLEEKISVRNIYLRVTPTETAGQCRANVHFVLHNDASFPLYTKFGDESYAVGDGRSKEVVDDRATTLIGPKGEAGFLTSTMLVMRAKIAEGGDMQTEVCYCRRGDDVECRLQFSADFNLSEVAADLPPTMVPGRFYQVGIPHRVRRIEYSTRPPRKWLQ